MAEYESLVDLLTANPNVGAGQMFGKPCLTVHGKAFLAHHKEAIIFKLNEPPHSKAMQINGAALWDPSGKARPMKEWVAVPIEHGSQFKELARAALIYVSGSIDR
jgi:hypothetical protein